MSIVTRFFLGITRLARGCQDSVNFLPLRLRRESRPVCGTSFVASDIPLPPLDFVAILALRASLFALVRFFASFVFLPRGACDSVRNTVWFVLSRVFLFWLFDLLGLRAPDTGGSKAASVD